MRNSQLVGAVVVVVLASLAGLAWFSQRSELDKVPMDGGGKLPATDPKLATPPTAKPNTPITPNSAKPITAAPTESSGNAPARRPATEPPPVTNLPRPSDTPRSVLTPPPTSAPSVAASTPTSSPDIAARPTATRPVEAGSLPPVAAGSGSPGSATPTTPARAESRPTSTLSPIASANPTTPPGRNEPPARGGATTRPTVADPARTAAPERRTEIAGEPPNPIATPGTEKRTHKIASGDTLAKLAKQYLGDEKRWRKIKEANPGLDENRLAVGQEVIIPAAGASTTASRTTPNAGSTATKPAVAANKPTAPEPSKPVDAARPATAASHKVGAGDTLIQIARKVLKDENRWREIFELNRDQLKSADDLRVGMVLKLPKAKADTPAGSSRPSGTGGNGNRPRRP